MSKTFLRFPIALALVAAGLISSVGGCSSGVEPGDYVVYRIAYTEPNPGSSCYKNKDTPPNEQSDSNSFLTSGTLVIYAGANDVVYMDSGDMTLEGTFASDVYTFDGRTVDVHYTGAGTDGDKQTTTITTHIELTVDGSSITGNRTDKVTKKCSPSGDAQCKSFVAIPSCTITTDFVGIEIDDVTIKHDV